MTHVMAKGANISLTAAAVRAVLRWNTTPGSPDVDVSALLVGPGGKVGSDADFVFYNQPRHPSGLVRHLPKQQPAGTGGEVSDLVEVDLAKLPPEVHRVVLAASAEEGSFQAVSGLRMLLHDTGAGTTTTARADCGAPVAEFTVPDPGEVSALVVAELYRRDGAWKFRAIGQGYASGLSGLATDFGIAVDDEDAPDQGPSPADAPPPVPQPAPQAAPQPAPQPVRYPATTLPDPRDEPDTYTLAPAAPTPGTYTPAPAAQAPGAYTLAPAVPMPSTPPPPPPLPPQQPGYTYPQTPVTAAYGYPQPQQPTYGYPAQQPQPGYGYPPPPPQPPLHQQPYQAQQPQYQEQPPLVLPLQGPQFQPPR
ncbi:hypothetical protein GCM10009760_50480 [Kitasatospora kazusensis]|uniref:TerD domain-containing protein n=1 Tax=Kitasatospora kazusensis TaxID=407974 RepID=A0ABP5LSI9_9ACTN